MNLTAEKLIDILHLEPLPIEGGYFRRTYLSGDTIQKEHLPDRYHNYTTKSFCSAIYYLLTPTTYSKIHRLPTDEVFHFYLGDTVEMLLLGKEGEAKTITIGTDIINGALPQVVVPKYTWQGCRLQAGGKFALMGTTMAPAFDFADFESPNDLATLLEAYPPEYHDLIAALF